MFFVVVGTHTKSVINKFAPGARIIFLIFQCHTVTNGTDLRRSPLLFKSFFASLQTYSEYELCRILEV